MTRPIGYVVLVCVPALVLVFGGAPNLSASAAAVRRTVYVSVTDAHGAFIDDLTAVDFAAKEGGTDREVIAAAPFRGSADVAVLVEENLTGDGYVRNGLLHFVQRLGGRAATALIVMGIRNVTLVDFTKDLNAFATGMSQFSLHPFPGAHHVAEDVFDASKDFMKREGVRRVMVVLAIEREQEPSVTAHDVMEQIRKSGISLYAITLDSSAAASNVSLGGLADASGLGEVLGDGSRNSGGHRQEVTLTAGIPKALDQFADELLHQYAVTYAQPDGVKPGAKLSMSVKRRGLSVHAPTWAPDR